MEESDDIEDYEFIPMKQCHQRSRSLPFNQFRQIPEVEKPRKSSAHPTLSYGSIKSHNSFKVGFYHILHIHFLNMEGFMISRFGFKITNSLKQLQ